MLLWQRDIDRCDRTLIAASASELGLVICQVLAKLCWADDTYKQRGNVLKHLDNAWTVGPVWTSYILVSAIYTKDGTAISNTFMILTQPIHFSKPTVSNQYIIQVQEITYQLLFEVKINRNDFFPVKKICINSLAIFSLTMHIIIYMALSQMAP